METKPSIKDARRTIWISDELWHEIRNAAEQDGVTVSHWIRATITATLKAESKWRKDPLFTVDGL